MSIWVTDPTSPFGNINASRKQPKYLSKLMFLSPYKSCYLKPCYFLYNVDSYDENANNQFIGKGEVESSILSGSTSLGHWASKPRYLS